MIKLKIVRNADLPKIEGRGRKAAPKLTSKYQFDKLKVLDAVDIEVAKADYDLMRDRITSAAFKFGARTNRKFAFRKMSDTTMRVRREA